MSYPLSSFGAHWRSGSESACRREQALAQRYRDRDRLVEHRRFDLAERDRV
jgi:hypothetical protein